MKTEHHIYFENAKSMTQISSGSVDLVATSPPYPMIKMWDEMFAGQNRRLQDALAGEKNLLAYDLMHRELDQVWNEVYRVLKSGAIACINIGDAVRTMGNDFMLYANHSRILTYLLDIGFAALPLILWRKQTNAPNKFMGSGMLPAGAYVTLEHEYILILRKGSKREFESTAEKKLRRESAIFWEERNFWYSDVWLDLKGTTQKLQSNNNRLRSAAFPFEIPYRLINMFSVKGDTVLDPFLGTGTTMWAAMTAGRNSIGFEMEDSFKKTIFTDRDDMVQFSNQIISDRIDRHMDFVRDRYETKGEFKYLNKHYNFPVVTQQEKELFIDPVTTIVKDQDNQLFEVEYASTPHVRFDDNMEDYITEQQTNLKRRKRKRQIQLKWHK
jgi:DNA modification methylase